MSDFVSGFWSIYVGGITLLGILFCAWLLKATTTRRLAGKEKAEVTGHVWDENLEEYNNPLPRWWVWAFYISIAFGLGYLALYPGLGSFQGVLGWSSGGEHQADVTQADIQYAPIFVKYLKQDIAEIARDPEARGMGQRLFLNYCAQCHGSDARGGKGFPNLTDNDWLYGGTPQDIKTSITEGRNGVMPPWGQALSGDDIKDVTYYVLSLSGFPADGLKIYSGRKIFMNTCAACHGADGKGNPAMGAPNLNDKVWLHGGSIAAVTETITKGRNSHMPAHKDLLDEAKINLLAGYVYGLSNNAGSPGNK